MSDLTNFEILTARAAHLALPEVNEESLDGLDSRLSASLVVSLDPHKYAFPLIDVTEVLRLDQLTFVPGFPSFIAGIFPYRGMVLTALDLRKFLEIPSPGITQLDRVVIIEDGKSSMGVLIDRVEGVDNIDTVALQKQISGLGTGLQGIMYGVAPEGYVLLDVKKIFSEPRLLAMLQV